MWILHFLPDSYILYAVYAGMALGAAATIASFVLTFLPFTKEARLTIQFVGLLLLLPSIYAFSGYGVEMEWKAKAKDMEDKVKEAEKKAPVITKKIVTKYKDKIVIVGRQVDVIKKEIEIKKEIINEGCKLNPTAVEVYNKGITGVSVDVGPLIAEEKK